MSTIEEIEIIVESLEGNKLCIFQCTSSYPTNPSEVCLGVTPQLKENLIVILVSQTILEIFLLV